MNADLVAECRAGQPIQGTWLSLGSPIVAEIATECGFDWLLFDLEHGSVTDLVGCLRATGGRPAMAIVRVQSANSEAVLQALDGAADGIMFPHVNNAQDADACVQAVHYPPRGHRGFSRTVRTYGYGFRPPDETALANPPLVIAQIESIRGVECAKDIAAVDGVDVLFVGPADLNFDIRVSNSQREYADCLTQVIDAARTHGKGAGILIRDPAEIAEYIGMGFTMIAVDSDISILRKGFLGLQRVGQSQSGEKS